MNGIKDKEEIKSKIRRRMAITYAVAVCMISDCHVSLEYLKL